MIEPNVRKQVGHLVLDIKGMNFSGFTRGLLKAVLFLIGDRSLSATLETEIVTLCSDPQRAPLIMLQLTKQHYCSTLPELEPHFDAIINAIQNCGGDRAE